MGAPVTKIEYDGKFTVSYELADGTDSAFRCVPEMARLIAQAERMAGMMRALAGCEGFGADNPITAFAEEARAILREIEAQP